MDFPLPLHPFPTLTYRIDILAFIHHNSREPRNDDLPTKTSLPVHPHIVSYPDHCLIFFCSRHQTMYMEGHRLTSRQPAPAKDGVNHLSSFFAAFMCSQPGTYLIFIVQKDSVLSLGPHWRSQIPAEAVYAGWTWCYVFCMGAIATQQTRASLHSGSRSEDSMGMPATWLAGTASDAFAAVVTIGSCMQAKGRILLRVACFYVY